MFRAPDEIVLAHLKRGPQTEAEIAEATALPLDQVQQALDYLAADGHLAMTRLVERNPQGETVAVHEAWKAA